MSARLSAHDFIDLVLDAGTFESWDTPIDYSDVESVDTDYAHVIQTAKERAGTDESVVSGRGEVQGRPVAVIVNEFSFMAGSIGERAAKRIVNAVQRATELQLPLLAAAASGGTRMQEGTPAFLAMMQISRAVMEHRAAGMPYLMYLRHPTTGGVFASWGSLAHITVAEPGALIGFLGPKVYQALHAQPFPPGVQIAENLAAHGVIDAVVPPQELPQLVELALRVLADPPAAPALPRRTGEITEADAWDNILSTRQNSRAGVRDLLRYGATDTVWLQGTGEGERDSSVIVALTRLDGQPCVVVGQDRARQNKTRLLGPGALRQARRGMNLAQELRLPLVTVIDTPGAELSAQAEEGAIAGEIARCIATMSTLETNTVAILLGQGCGGAALALLAAQTVIATERAWLAPLPFEGASAILYGDTDHAPQMARAQRIRATDMYADGDVQFLVPEVQGERARELALAVAAECAHVLAAQRGE